MPNEQAYSRLLDRRTVALGASLASFVCGALLGLTIYGRWLLASPAPAIPATSVAAVPSPSPTMSPTAIPATETPTPEPTVTATNMPPIYVTLNVNSYPEYTVYWKRDLWESAVGATPTTEDFESDEADTGAITAPYFTAHSLLFTPRQGEAQLFNDHTLMPSGNLLFYKGVDASFTFPDSAVRAFGFDYRTIQAWQLNVNGFSITIPGGRRSFFGILLRNGRAQQFELLYTLNAAQNGLSLDNISWSR